MGIYDKKIGELVNKLKLILFQEKKNFMLVLFMINQKLVLLEEN